MVFRRAITFLIRFAIVYTRKQIEIHICWGFYFHEECAHVLCLFLCSTFLSINLELDIEWSHRARVLMLDVLSGTKEIESAIIINIIWQRQTVDAFL